MLKRILLVEDEEDNLTLFIHILQRLLGHTVFIAHDGHEAIEQAKANNPDIILMDLTLPKLTGWEAARSLKGMAEFRNTPIIALTAHAMAGDRERAIEAGCDSYFAKPIDVDTFLAFLAPFLADASAQSPDQSTPPAVVTPPEAAAQDTPPPASESTEPSAAVEPPPSDSQLPSSPPLSEKPESQADHESTDKQSKSTAKGEPA